MNIPSFPTDNLYKFIAIFGLVAIIASFYYAEKSIFSFNEETTKNENTTFKYYAEMALYQDEIHHILNSSNSISESYGLKPAIIQKDSMFIYREYSGLPTHIKDSLSNLFHSIHLINEEHAHKKIQVDAEKRLRQNLIDKSDDLVDLFGILLEVGIFLTITGFLLWYFKIQRPLDIYEQNKIIENPLFNKHCQSCARTISFVQERGSNKNKLLNHYYCNKCYVNGEFIEPELSYLEMKQRITLNLAKLKINKLKRYIILVRLSRCKRWILQRTW